MRSTRLREGSGRWQQRSRGNEGRGGRGSKQGRRRGGSAPAPAVTNQGGALLAHRARAQCRPRRRPSPDPADSKALNVAEEGDSEHLLDLLLLFRHGKHEHRSISTLIKVAFAFLVFIRKNNIFF